MSPRGQWLPSHRVLVRIGEPGSLHGLSVMTTPDGAAYTCYAWVNHLIPTFRFNARQEWVVADVTQMAAAPAEVVRVEPLDESPSHAA